MGPRIEIAEVVSFRLKLPLGEVERLPLVLARDLPLTLGRDRGEVLLHTAEGDSALKFRPVGHDAVLTEVAICNDENGTFFQRVLGPLMVRFGGDCELRMVWNTPDRNTHGDFGAVTIRNGQTNYPGLSQPAQALRNALAQSAELNGELSSAPSGSERSAPRGGRKAPAASKEDDGPSPELAALLREEAEVERLLIRGRELFAEYQQRKAR